jgi:hypothetical protein
MSIIERALNQATERWMLGHLERAFWLWDHANRAWFDGSLSTPFIEIALPQRATNRAGHAYADIGPDDEHGVRLAVRLHPELLRSRDPDWHRPADRDVLHEQVHGWQVEALGWPWEPDLDWHGRTFRSKLAEVERAYALDLTVTRRSTWR